MPTRPNEMFRKVQRLLFRQWLSAVNVYDYRSVNWAKTSSESELTRSLHEEVYMCFLILLNRN